MGVALMISEPMYASLNMSLQISKNAFSNNNSEHFISGGNALLDTVTLIISPKSI